MSQTCSAVCVCVDGWDEGCTAVPPLSRDPPPVSGQHNITLVWLVCLSREPLVPLGHRHWVVTAHYDVNLAHWIQSCLRFLSTCIELYLYRGIVCAIVIVIALY